MGDSERRAGNACERCGSLELELVAARITKTAGGFVNFFQCKKCGELALQDIPHQPPGQRAHFSRG